MERAGFLDGRRAALGQRCASPEDKDQQEVFAMTPRSTRHAFSSPSRPPYLGIG